MQHASAHSQQSEAKSGAEQKPWLTDTKWGGAAGEWPGHGESVGESGGGLYTSDWRMDPFWYESRVFSVQ